jgi:hypothetical protein
MLPCDVLVGRLRGLEHCFAALRFIESVDECERLGRFVSQNRRAPILAERCRDGLGAREERRRHDLVAEHEVIDDRVMTIELKTPRLRRAGSAHDRDVVLPFAVLVEIVVRQLGEGVIQTHDVARQL